MCGLAGSLRADLDVDAALDRIAHRGPDGRGVVEHDDAVHGHVRLAILDLDPRSDQPFTYDGGTLSYVGEAWNFRVVRDELESLGRRFATEGDTEVVAAALAEWGPAALERLEGMFALAWTCGDLALLARDRFGKVPLYALRRDDGWLWASERKGLGDLGGHAHAVPPGSWVDLRTGAVNRWYSVPHVRAEHQWVGALVERGVEARLLADAPLCCLISGGLDSALVLALTHRLKPDVVAYHAVFDPDSEDLRMARLLCRELGVELREHAVGEPTRDDLERAVETIEVPSKTQVEIALLAIPLAERIATDGFKCVLSGEAADELFGGYGTLARRATTDEVWRAARLEFLAKMGRSDFMRVNKTLMAAGVEGRLPFMERELVEVVTSLGKADCPPGKRLLKRFAADHLPEEIIRRPKQTFQGGAGMAEHCARILPSPQKAYNDLVRRQFGGVLCRG